MTTDFPPSSPRNRSTNVPSTRPGIAPSSSSQRYRPLNRFEEIERGPQSGARTPANDERRAHGFTGRQLRRSKREPGREAATANTGQTTATAMRNPRRSSFAALSEKV